MPIRFDERGYIIPPKKEEMSLEEFEEIFVKSFSASSTRATLFAGYLSYTRQFKVEIAENFIHWIGGSFTTKKVNPNDIDLVTIIPHETFEAHIKLIEEKFRKKSLSEYGIDAYIVAAYPEGHKKYSLYQGNIVYWDNQFSKTRKNRAGKRFNRGYIQIIHQKKES